MGGKTEIPDSNLPTGDSSSPNPPIQLHNFVPMPSLVLDDNQDDNDGDSGFMSFLRENMQQFWIEQLTEISNASDPGRQLLLPITQVKRMMKSDDKVQMVSGDAPILLAKSTELFVMELTLRAWLHAQKDNHRTLHDCDFARAIIHDELLAQLLSNVIGGHDLKEEADNHKETEPQVAGPSHVHDLNPPYVENAEFSGQFPMSLSSVQSNHSRGSEDFYTRKPEIVEQFSSSMSSIPSSGRPGSDVAITSLMSSLPSNYCPGSEAFYDGNPDFAKFPSSSPSVPSYHSPGSE